jgi:prepilin-type processing-associated H-X9-DG protein
MFRVGHPSAAAAFTLTELMVMTGMLLLFCCLVVAAASDNRAANRTLQCLNNLQQLGRGWLMYADDHRGRLAPNKGNGTTAAMACWVGGQLDLGINPANTNLTYLIGPAPYCGMLGPYVRSPSYFRCPSDPSTVPVAAGLRLPRVRSYSMNNFVGEGARVSSGMTTSFQLFETLPSIGRPKPSELWVIIEEHPESLNDGIFFTEPDNSTPTFVDLPAAFHNSSCNFVYADGHADSYRWSDKRMLFPIGGPINANPSPNNADLIFLQSHATALK